MPGDLWLSAWLMAFLFHCVFFINFSKGEEAAYLDSSSRKQRSIHPIDYNADYPSLSDLYSTYNKRFMPHWYHSLNSRDFYQSSSPIAQAKRFLPFHPLARFRGLARGGSGGGGGGVSSSTSFMTSPYQHRQNFETYVASSSQPSPGHPVPSDVKSHYPLMSHPTALDLTQSDNNYLDDEDSEGENSKVSAGDILSYLNSLSTSAAGDGRPKLFRFGIK